MTIAWACLALSVHQFLLTRFYLETCPAPLRAAESAPEESPGIASPVRLRRWAWRVTVVGSTVAVVAIVFSLARMPADDAVAVTAHRGSSRLAPENTLAALRQAINDGADYAEIDVQTTRDGHLIVLHDADLMRMAGDRRRVEDLTLAELKDIDVGARFSSDFRGEHVPTLREAIALVRGRMRLNIELKYNRPDPTLGPKVIELLRAEAFVDQCVITSLDQAALREVESVAPDLVTGLIVTAVVGDVTRAATDFLSLNAAQATDALVALAHQRGKGVHVWTVNTERAMLEMIERGVDNIITDEPARLVGLMRARAELDPATRLALRLRTIWLPGGDPLHHADL